MAVLGLVHSSLILAACLIGDVRNLRGRKIPVHIIDLYVGVSTLGALFYSAKEKIQRRHGWSLLRT